MRAVNWLYFDKTSSLAALVFYWQTNMVDMILSSQRN